MRCQILDKVQKKLQVAVRAETGEENTAHNFSAAVAFRIDSIEHSNCRRNRSVQSLNDSALETAVLSAFLALKVRIYQNKLSRLRLQGNCTIAAQLLKPRFVSIEHEGA